MSVYVFMLLDLAFSVFKPDCIVTIINRVETISFFFQVDTDNFVEGFMLMKDFTIKARCRAYVFTKSLFNMTQCNE